MDKHNAWKKFTWEPRIAYFSMEIGISAEIPTYSGGLGILAGDTIKSAADLDLPMVAVTLIHRKGYFRQQIDPQGWQREFPVEWSPEKYLELLPVKALVTVEGRDVKIQPWLYRVKSPAGGVVPVLLLDTDIPGNAEDDRHLTDYLYGGDLEYRLKQEIILGIGGARILSALNFNIRKYHMNEGHAAMLTLDLLSNTRGRVDDPLEERASWDTHRVMEQCVFTTHTPVEAGHDKFPWDMVERILPEIVPFSLLRDLAGRESFNLTLLALNLSNFVNGVAKKHGEISKSMFPGFKIHAITNGIHSFTWTSPFFVQLYNKYLPGWANEPELLVRVDNIPDEEIWDAHSGAKAFLFLYIEETTGQRLDPDLLTIGFARRSATYKRADLILSDLDRLLHLGEGRLQLIFAGKSHPRDLPGKEMIHRIYEKIEHLKGKISVVYLENYNMDVAYRLIPGVDLWLNTPVRPLEASGTSGMKAAINGVPNFSVLDGWWIEGHIEGVTGWSIGPPPRENSTIVNGDNHEDAQDLYHKLENVILPLYTENRAGWIQVMKNAIGKNAYYFNTHVMMRRYVTEAYIR
ncbi:alpha-glucan family phosphorylase [Geoalkalibacter halelectricus]|uniref:Alpha-glucan family phosphorylase n=1 Tax=Geoalkalibacter halelectricus TaxID=2847045 RepID=A0ABY5ZRF5_9BACT|nr:alpha-glucan family phosphorylase [Geoalkalibacter halelectricus]MDO3379988.1 alpha-glucan family phosphorylase [Geoalkalibacter halelectricus]UWZ80485.1 alpha-glucan family phosphorylase [Geoalkalibacter halelectricus]